jgi:hypothetical protein
MDKLWLNIQKNLTNKNNPNAQSLLQSQQLSQEKINEMLEQSSQAIMCGPECQKAKVSEDLKQKYLDAETNMQTAPMQLDQSKKNYYVYTEGRAYYDNMQEQELIKKADTIAEVIKENFNKEVANANVMNDYLNTALINSKNTTDLLNDFIRKNQSMKSKLRQKRGDILTNDRKTYYETEAIDRLGLWYSFYWYIYYIMMVVLLLAFMFSPSGLSIIPKLVIFAILLFYPYYVDYINRWIYGQLVWAHNSIPKNVYNNL